MSTETTSAALPRPVCAHCGNDGTAGRLYVTVDARFDPATGGWVLEARDDASGSELDCLACDERSADPEFPYEMTIPNAAAGVDLNEALRIVALLAKVGADDAPPLVEELETLQDVTDAAVSLMEGR